MSIKLNMSYSQAHIKVTLGESELHLYVTWGQGVTMTSFMKAIADKNEIEIFQLFLYDGWINVPKTPEGYTLKRVAARVEEGKYGLVFIYRPQTLIERQVLRDQLCG